MASLVFVEDDRDRGETVGRKSKLERCSMSFEVKFQSVYCFYRLPLVEPEHFSVWPRDDVDPAMHTFHASGATPPPNCTELGKLQGGNEKCVTKCTYVHRPGPIAPGTERLGVSKINSTRILNERFFLVGLHISPNKPATEPYIVG